MVEKKENTDFGFIVFEPEQIDEIANQVGLKFNKNNYLIDENKTVICKCCGRHIRKSNIGNILPGSNIVLCDNPVCFAEYMDTNLNL